MEIKSIELGYGAQSTFYSTTLEPESSYYVDRIIPDLVVAGRLSMISYVGYRNDKPVFRMFAGDNITLYY